MANRIQTRKNRQAAAFKALEVERDAAVERGKKLAAALGIEREEGAKLKLAHDVLEASNRELGEECGRLTAERDAAVKKYENLSGAIKIAEAAEKAVGS